jgi:hypothetical protein
MSVELIDIVGSCNFCCDQVLGGVHFGTGKLCCDEPIQQAKSGSVDEYFRKKSMASFDV